VSPTVEAGLIPARLREGFKPSRTLPALERKLTPRPGTGNYPIDCVVIIEGDLAVCDCLSHYGAGMARGRPEFRSHRNRRRKRRGIDGDHVWDSGLE
jgi:hypothetical protein